jgi:hypothetical protein
LKPGRAACKQPIAAKCIGNGISGTLYNGHVLF